MARKRAAGTKKRGARRAHGLSTGRGTLLRQGALLLGSWLLVAMIAAAVTRASGDTTPAPPTAPARPALVKPPALSKGDGIALVAPAGPVDFDRVREARTNLQRLGYKVKLMRDVSMRAGYLAGDDAQRAFEIDRAFADPEIAMILCIRGGYGTPRLLTRLDYATIRKNPKILVGYSDVTALLNAVHQKTGLVTIHGPMAQGDFSGKWGLAPYASRWFWRLVGGVAGPDGATAIPDWGDGAPAKIGRRYTIAGGVAEGRLAGGNLSTIAALIGTPYEIDTEGAVLFLEDVNEEPFRIDRMLCQLKLAGKLVAIRGVLLGGFTNCVARNTRYSFTVEEVLREYFGNLGVPVLGGFPAGHLPEQAALPIGARVRVNATRKTVTILEAPVGAR